MYVPEISQSTLVDNSGFLSKFKRFLVGGKPVSWKLKHNKEDLIIKPLLLHSDTNYNILSAIRLRSDRKFYRTKIDNFKDRTVLSVDGDPVAYVQFSGSNLKKGQVTIGITCTEETLKESDMVRNRIALLGLLISHRAELISIFGYKLDKPVDLHLGTAEQYTMTLVTDHFKPKAFDKV